MHFINDCSKSDHFGIVHRIHEYRFLGLVTTQIRTSLGRLTRLTHDVKENKLFVMDDSPKSCGCRCKWKVGWWVWQTVRWGDLTASLFPASPTTLPFLLIKLIGLLEDTGDSVLSTIWECVNLTNYSISQLLSSRCALYGRYS